MGYQLLWGLYTRDSNHSDTYIKDYTSSIQIVKKVEASGTYHAKAET